MEWLLLTVLAGVLISNYSSKPDTEKTDKEVNKLPPVEIPKNPFPKNDKLDCSAEFDKLPAELKSQVSAAIVVAKSSGNADKIKPLADVLRPLYPAVAKCLDDFTV